MSSHSSAGKYLTVFHRLHEVYFRTRVFLVAKVLIDKVHCDVSGVGYLTNQSMHLDGRGDRLCRLCAIVLISTDVELREVSFGYLVNQTSCSAERSVILNFFARYSVDSGRCFFHRCLDKVVAFFTVVETT